MPLQKIRLREALKKIHHLKAPSMIIAERRKFTSPSSPTSTLVFRDDSDDDEDTVKKGFFAVYVGEELKRYVIPLNYLKHHLFAALLSQAEDEFGFSNIGAIRLPCDTVLFEHLLWLLSRDDPLINNFEMEELLNFYQ